MSTAGKVLVVLVMLSALSWLVLASGAARLNTNWNEQLQKLANDLEKAKAGLEETKHEIAGLHDQTSSAQEDFDRQVAVLRSRQTDLERDRSQIVEGLTRAQYQLATVEETIKGARTALEHRTEEHQAEEKAMTDLRSEVQGLKAENSQLMNRLQTLRDQFQSTYHTNLEMVRQRR
jgi:chromosome segregation ATPase